MKTFLTIAATLLCLAGCGGSSGSSPATQPQQNSGVFPSGTWAGTGDITATETDTRNGKCAMVQMTLTVRADSLHLEGLNFNCDFFWSSYGPYDAEIRGNELWVRGERIGTIDATGASVRISRLPASLETFDFRLIAPNRIQLHHREYVDAGTWKRTIDHSAVLDFQPQ